MYLPPEITRDRANEILIEASKGPRQQAAICYGGKWYDIRGMKPEEISAFVETLLGRPIGPKDQAWIGPCAGCGSVIAGNPRVVCSCGDIYCSTCVGILSQKELEETIVSAGKQGHIITLLSPEDPA